jgi:GNAT superfamily N-acetyltransferase
MDFYTRTGKMALGSRLRRLSEEMTEQAAGIYDLYQVDLQPKWFPVFYSLSAHRKSRSPILPGRSGIPILPSARLSGRWPSKVMWSKRKGNRWPEEFCVVVPGAGQQLREKMQPQLDDVTSAIEKAMKETHHDLWKAIGEWEFLLEQKSLLRRVREEKKIRESARIQIVDFIPAYQPAFRQLNEEWITTWFRMEEGDYKALDHPREYILDKGGHIFMALYKGEPVGTCSLIRMDDGSFELAKMGVSPKTQGLGIGYLLGRACIEKARALGARRVYLESNTRLKPAINLYHKLGFRKVAGPPSPYERCDIQMELVL